MAASSPYFMVFACASVGAAGETFAVGFVVVDGGGQVHAAGGCACPPERAAGDDAGRAWAAGRGESFPSLPTPADIRSQFWGWWADWRGRGALLAADGPWPAEARFLLDCVRD